MLDSLSKRLARHRMKSRIIAFGNHHSASTNRHYRAFHEAAKKAFDRRHSRSSEDIRAQVADLREHGFAVLPADPNIKGSLENLKSRIDAAFENEKNAYRPGPGVTRLMDGAELFPDILLLLQGHVEHVLEGFFESHFKIFSAAFYRTVPDDSVPHSSFLWHFDNAPDQQIKVMIYLDDVKESTGAFRFKRKEVSAQVRKAGFWHRDDYERARAIFDDETSTHVVEGPVGTMVLFQPGRVVHKATAPEHDHRDVVVLVTNPSKIYWREHLARNRHLISTNAGICLDLERDIPEEVGYRY
jgi:hypothetical protein